MNIPELLAYQTQYRQGDLPVSLSQAPAWFAGHVDRWVSSTAENMLGAHSPVLVLAVGGYGRATLHPYSDIDLCLLIPDDHGLDLETLAQAFFLPLWDSGFDVGHGIRTWSDSLALAAQDFEVLCSLLDARLLYGSFTAFSQFRARFTELVLTPKRAGLVSWLEDRFERRQQRQAASAHHVSPNLKDGRGGLRDAQTLAWLQAACTDGEAAPSTWFDTSEAAVLQRAGALLSAARVALHRASRRKNDVLHLELQAEVALVLGYDQETPVGRVELFLSDLHRSMTDITSLCRYVVPFANCPQDIPRASVTSGLDFSVLASHPANILELCMHCAQLSQPLSWQARRVIQDRIAADSFPDRWPASITGRFQEILCSAQAGKALEQMLEVGFLAAFIPEFKPVEHFVQFDAYHQLPVGYHLVETVHQLTLFTADNSFLGECLASLAQDPVLRWAALLHDIGKVFPEHCRAGAQLSAAILQRLGFDQAFIDDCCFLITNHLLLIHEATRHDLGEERVVVNLAQSIGTVQRLDALALLTWADSNATGPKAWTPWIRNLVREAYFKLRRLLESDLHEGEHLVQRLTRVRDTLRVAKPDSFSVSEFERYLAVMPPRYLLQTKVSRIVEHVRLVDRYRQQSEVPVLIDWQHRPNSGSMRLTIISRDRSGFFARVCAALGKHNLCVLGAELCVWEDGTVVDVFWVSEPLDPLYADQTMELLVLTLNRLLGDEAALDCLDIRLSAQQKKLFTRDEELVDVRLDNDASDFHTVLIVEAPDVAGLLSAVSLTLCRLGFDLVFAKIATQKGKAMDIFHIKQDGQKLQDHELPAVAATIRLLVCSLYS